MRRPAHGAEGLQHFGQLLWGCDLFAGRTVG
jgi:hypothetical protein